MNTFDWIRTLGVGVALISQAVLHTAPARAQASPTPGAGQKYWVYVGNNGTDGIGLFKLDTDKGTLTPAGIAAPADKPGFLAITPNQQFLFAGIRGAKDGAIQGFAIDPATGKLTAINSASSAGDEPCFVSIDPAGKNVLTANYTAATVAVLPFDAAGKLSAPSSVITETGSGPDPQRQTKAYAHSINSDPSGKFAISCDLGADKLFIYKFDSAAGKLTANDPASVAMAPGSGPRHLTFHPNGKFVYVLSEMGGTVAGLTFDPAKGSLTQFQIIKTLKSDEKGNTSAEVQIDPAGKFLYASNRLTTNYLTIFAIDPATGMLTLKGYQDSLGKTPRSFRIDPTGHFMVLANQDSNTLVLFRIDPATGALTPIGSPIPTVKEPICIKFLAAPGA